MAYIFIFKTTLFLVHFVTGKWDEHPYKLKQKTTVIKERSHCQPNTAFKKL